MKGRHVGGGDTCPPGSCQQEPTFQEGSGTYQDHTGVDQRERPRASDSRAAVHDGGALVLPQPPRLSHFKQEVEEGRRGLGDPEVRPGGVMEVADLSLLPRLWRQRTGRPGYHTTQLPPLPRRSGAVSAPAGPLQSQLSHTFSHFLFRFATVRFLEFTALPSQKGRFSRRCCSNTQPGLSVTPSPPRNQTYAHILQLQQPGGVIGLDVF